jgi:hypothetical protein
VGPLLAVDAASAISARAELMNAWYLQAFL